MPVTRETLHERYRDAAASELRAILGSDDYSADAKGVARAILIDRGEGDADEEAGPAPVAASRPSRSGAASRSMPFRALDFVMIPACLLGAVLVAYEAFATSRSTTGPEAAFVVAVEVMLLGIAAFLFSRALVPALIVGASILGVWGAAYANAVDIAGAGLSAAPSMLCAALSIGAWSLAVVLLSPRQRR
jgi:hypothetical protein